MRSNKKKTKKKAHQPNKRCCKYKVTLSLGKEEKHIKSLPNEPLAKTELGSSPRDIIFPNSVAVKRTLGNQKGFQHGFSEHEEEKLRERPLLWEPANATAGSCWRRILLPALPVSVIDAFVEAGHWDAASFPLQV